MSYNATVYTSNKMSKKVFKNPQNMSKMLPIMCPKCCKKGFKKSLQKANFIVCWLVATT